MREVRGTLWAASSPRCARKNEDVALLLPDSVIRVFVLHFDVFPRMPKKRFRSFGGG